MHPTEQIFASCGSDKVIRIWDPTKMLRKSEPFPYDITALDWSSDGALIAVGDRKGGARIVDAKTLQIYG